MVISDRIVSRHDILRMSKSARVHRIGGSESLDPTCSPNRLSIYDLHMSQTK